MTRTRDDDASNLPPGMKRIGYDADTERYTFRQGNNLWLGEPGSFYGGQLKWAGKAQDVTTETNDDEKEDEDEDLRLSDRDDESVEAQEPVTLPDTSRVREQTESREGGNENEWGVPVHSISETDPKSLGGAGHTLKRRATRFKEVAKSTAVAIGVTRRWTSKRPGGSVSAPQRSNTMPHDNAQSGKSSMDSGE